MRTPLPFGELIPLYGVYTEGFWDREITPMPGSYWAGFHFSKLRVNNDIGTDQLGRRRAQDPPDVERYPYLTCEIGGGMMNSYHRRILIDPADIESATLVKIGSGSVSPGYYMYHGGENPDGKLTTLEESQATGYWNDMPVKNYDFQAPLGEYGQIRPQYQLLRRLHLFLHEWGSSLAQMGVALPDVRPAGKDDVSTLRWSVRSDGESGFVFVNNYERLRDLPEKTNVQFAIKLSAGTLLFPQNPVTIPATSRFFWPFNFNLGQGVKLISATAQPLCAIQDGDVRVVFFAESKGIPAEFVFDKSTEVKSFGTKLINKGDYQIAPRVPPGRKPVLEIATAGGKLQLVLLDEADSLAFWKGTWQGRDRVILSQASVVLDGLNLRLTSTERDDLNLGIYPPPAGMMCNGKYLRPVNDGIFARFTPGRPEQINLKATVEMIQPAGPLRKIVPGKIEQPVAAAPEDADFAQAAIWRIKLPDNLDLGVDPLLRLKYVGDVARITLNGKLLTDDFYNGKAFEVGLARYAPGILAGDLRLAILPLQKNAPIYLAKKAQPDFGTATSLAALRGMEIVPRYTLTLSEREDVSQAAN